MIYNIVYYTSIILVTKSANLYRKMISTYIYQSSFVLTVNDHENRPHIKPQKPGSWIF